MEEHKKKQDAIKKQATRKSVAKSDAQKGLSNQHVPGMTPVVGPQPTACNKVK